MKTSAEISGHALRWENYLIHDLKLLGEAANHPSRFQAKKVDGMLKTRAKAVREALPLSPSRPKSDTAQQTRHAKFGRGKNLAIGEVCTVWQRCFQASGHCWLGAESKRSATQCQTEG